MFVIVIDKVLPAVSAPVLVIALVTTTVSIPEGLLSTVLVQMGSLPIISNPELQADNLVYHCARINCAKRLLLPLRKTDYDLARGWNRIAYF